MNHERLCSFVCACEIAGFVLVIALSWFGELIDIPHIVFGFEPTPFNYVESICESALTIGLLLFVLFVTRRLFRKIRHLEGMLPVCSFCKKIRVNNEWVPIEQYIQHHSEATFSHSYCPDCVHTHFGELFVDVESAMPEKHQAHTPTSFSR